MIYFISDSNRRQLVPGHVDKVSRPSQPKNPAHRNSVEADLVVLGSCIPTLQPLLELILGKRSLGSSSHPPSYPYDSTNSRPKRSQLSRRTQDTLQLGSEENILPVDLKKESSGMKIQRTDHVVVEYEMHRLSPEQHRDNGAIPSGMR